MKSSVAAGVSVLLLILSSSVMVVAWYLHLKFDKWPLWKAILLSWLIAFMEYCAMVPANRVGHLQGGLSPAHLRAIAEVCVLSAFLVFSTLVLKHPLLLNHVVGFVIVAAGVFVVLFGPLDQVLYDPTTSSGEVAHKPPEMANSSMVPPTIYSPVETTTIPDTPETNITVASSFDTDSTTMRKGNSFIFIPDESEFP